MMFIGTYRDLEVASGAEVFDGPYPGTVDLVGVPIERRPEIDWRYRPIGV